MERITAKLQNKIRSKEEAAAMVTAGSVVGCSGFTLIGEPKAVPKEIARQGKADHLTILTGASVGDSLDGELARAGLIARRYPYQGNKSLREGINNGSIAYADMHLSHMPRFLNMKTMDIDWAIVECSAVTEDGIIPTAAVGASDCFIRNARHIILEVNSSLPAEILGIHDIYTANGDCIPIRDVADRIGTAYIPCDFSKVEAVVETDNPGAPPVFTDPDDISKNIAEHIVDFLKKEVSEGRQPKNLNPLQSGVGSVANAVMAGLGTGAFKGLRMYTEVIQDSALNLIRNGYMTAASTTSVSISGKAMPDFYDHMDEYRKKIVLRPQEIANSPEVIRRLGVIALNTPIECDIYGNVNSTHIMGTRMMNGIGGSGDFIRNASLSIFATGSLAKNGNISCIVPMCAHVDHTEHDVQVIVTEYGLADLRWKSPRERAQLIIENCAHPNYRPLLREYFRDACRLGGHTPVDLKQALSWHQRYLDTGSMF